ncbi:M15 family metallopeptidase [Nocardioides sp. MAHUQ-72]|uniref:M15 family metallopeptidase n=1 Tax=unclassified Nocardioides TaxID=2615069 RepID=UPI003605B55A
MRPGPRITALCLAVLVITGLGSAPAQSQEPVPTTLTMTARPVHADRATTLQVDLVQETDGAPVVGAPVTVERRTDGAWATVATVVTDEAGHAEVEATLGRDASDNVFRASYPGDAAHAPSATGRVAVALVRRASRVRIVGPDRVVDEQRVTLEVRWSTGNGTPVSGRVRVFRRNGDRPWRLDRTVTTDQDGRAQLSSRPRTDTRWRAEVKRSDWYRADTSPVHRVDNLPPGVPVRLPAAAPRPRVHLPAQPHAVGEGPNVTITRVPQRVWDRMTGISWRSGCPVGRAQLRYVRINYWDYRGYRRRGELVANADAAGRMAAALSDMYAAKLPLRSLYLVDRFGYSKRVKGGNDFRSMAAGNTSAFNCRDVVNRPGVRSPHSWGRSLDLNTWENPYRSARGLVPNSWWQSHSHPRVAWRSRSHAVVRIMVAHGLRWTYGLGDTQHFDAPAGNGRFMARPPGCDGVCE